MSNDFESAEALIVTFLIIYCIIGATCLIGIILTRKQ
jgi:hypothetical protein